MLKYRDNSNPRFNVGDQVKVTFPGAYRGKDGPVMEIVEHRGDFVWRYRVRFADGKTLSFFEFDLEKA